MVACYAGNVQLQLRAAVRPEKVSPSAKLEALLIPLRPTSAELAPLQVRQQSAVASRTADLHDHVSQ